MSPPKGGPQSHRAGASPSGGARRLQDPTPRCPGVPAWPWPGPSSRRTGVGPSSCLPCPTPRSLRPRPGSSLSPGARWPAPAPSLAKHRLWGRRRPAPHPSVQPGSPGLWAARGPGEDLGPGARCPEGVAGPGPPVLGHGSSALEMVRSLPFVFLVGWGFFSLFLFPVFFFFSPFLPSFLFLLRA